MNSSIAFARKTSLAYAALCRPLCQQLNLPQTAFDILMFLANNPDYHTASDIVEVRRIKANLVSVNVERLAREAGSRPLSIQRRTVSSLTPSRPAASAIR